MSDEDGQQRRRGILRTLAIAAALAVGGVTGTAVSWWVMNGMGMGSGSPDPAFQGADFELPDLDGGMRSLDDFSGQVVAVNFWASWCPPCVREMPMFQELQEAYGDEGFTFVGIAVDNEEDAAEFAERTGVTYPILFGRGEAMAAGDALGNERGTLPYTVLFDADGEKIETWARELERDELEPYIRNALENGSAP